MQLVKDFNAEGFTFVYKEDDVWKRINTKIGMEKVRTLLRDCDKARVRTGSWEAVKMTQLRDVDKEERTSAEGEGLWRYTIEEMLRKKKRK